MKRALHDICSQEQSNASTCSMQRPNSRVVPKQCFQCLQLVQCCYNCTMFTTRTMPRNVCNVYNSYPQFVSMRGYIHMLNTYAFLRCCNAASAAMLQVLQVLQVLHTHTQHNGCPDRDEPVSNTILGSVSCSSDKYRFEFYLLVFFSFFLHNRF